MFASTNQSVATELFSVDALKSDTVNFTKRIRRLYVGVGGTVVFVDGKGTAVTFSNVPSGYTIDAEGLRINATGTTASGMVGFV